jgi:hypothetical protein
MIERNTLEKEIDQEMSLLDSFAHPTMSGLNADLLAEEMLKQYRHDHRRRLLFRVLSPLATAAVIAVAGLLMFSDTVQTNSSKQPALAEAETLLAEWAEMENNAYGLFEDLNDQVSQISSTQPTVGSTDEEWNSSLIEAFDVGSSG